MAKPAIGKAQESLELAREALQRARRASGYRDFRKAWSEFLSCTVRVQNALGAGVKGIPASEVWMKRKRAEAKLDSLMQYLHQARHAEEHGIRPVTERQNAGIGIGRGQAIYIDFAGITGEGDLVVRGSEGGRPLSVSIIPEGARIITVINRGQAYDPPLELRAASTFPQITDAVAPALDYLARWIADADPYVQD